MNKENQPNNNDIAFVSNNDTPFMYTLDGQFETTLANPLELLHNFLEISRKNSEKIEAERLENKRKNYKYTFVPLDIEQTFGKNTYTYFDNGSVGYLAFNGNVIKSHIIHCRSVTSFLDTINKAYEDGKAYMFIDRVVHLKINKGDRRPYVSDKAVLKNKTHYLDDLHSILDIQNGKVVIDTNTSLFGSDYTIKNNIYINKNQYIYIPTNTVVVNTSFDYKNTAVGTVYIKDYKQISTDKAIIFCAEKYIERNKHIEIFVKLNTITGKVEEILE